MTIAEIFQELGVDFREGGSHRHVTHGWTGIDCPNCSPGSGKFKLGVPPGTSRFGTCWTCGRVPLLPALQEITRRPWNELAKLLGDVEAEWEPQAKRPAGKLIVPSGIGPLQPAHHDYLASRGFDPHTIAGLWGVRGIGVAPRLSWRLWIPVYQGGEAVGWTTRSLLDDVPRRYVNAGPHEESMPIKQALYGEDFARHAVVVVEGPTDAWRVGPGAVATFGTAYTKSQVARLSRFPVRAVAYDREPEAQRAARRLCRELECFPGQTFRVELSASDPGEAGEEEVRELRERFLD